jgi:hypothetical protein
MPRLGAIKTSTARVIDLKTSFVALSPVVNPEALYPPHFKAVLARILCEPIPICDNMPQKRQTSIYAQIPVANVVCKPCEK